MQEVKYEVKSEIALKYPSLEKRGQGRFLDNNLFLKSPCIPLYQRGNILKRNISNN
jgi:hypothetical protein